MAIIINFTRCFDLKSKYPHSTKIITLDPPLISADFNAICVLSDDLSYFIILFHFLDVPRSTNMYTLELLFYVYCTVRGKEFFYKRNAANLRLCCYIFILFPLFPSDTVKIELYFDDLNRSGIMKRAILNEP